MWWRAGVPGGSKSKHCDPQSHELASKAETTRQSDAWTAVQAHTPWRDRRRRTRTSASARSRGGDELTPRPNSVQDSSAATRLPSRSAGSESRSDGAGGRAIAVVDELPDVVPALVDEKRLASSSMSSMRSVRSSRRCSRKLRRSGWSERSSFPLVLWRNPLRSASAARSKAEGPSRSSRLLLMLGAADIWQKSAPTRRCAHVELFGEVVVETSKEGILGKWSLASVLRGQNRRPTAADLYQLSSLLLARDRGKDFACFFGVISSWSRRSSSSSP